MTIKMYQNEIESGNSMKQFFNYIIENFQGITGFYLVLTSISHMISDEMSVGTGLFLMVIGIVNIVLHTKKKWDEI